MKYRWARQLGEECVEDAQCRVFEKNTFCGENSCVCDSGFYLIHGNNGSLCYLVYILFTLNTDEEPISKRRTTKERKARWLARQSQESLGRIRAVDAAAYRRNIKDETPAQSQARRERYAEAHHLVRDRLSQSIRDEAIYFIEAQVETHNCGPMNIICQYRKSKNFAAERPSDGKFTSCCRKGKIKLEKPSDALSNDFLYPNFLLDLLTSPNNPYYKNFPDNIRS
ncbi:hypothetical protein AVEN_184094-1 [Araneus ventricosus]|uniref:EB domain-containing protein n=1 Tax=Araneus ventricosus TaxID=182803 RepID=A0A4Y2CY67_ARAVE|nr:hypothetical protein AVEN_184094-1 [Araneus ventricosus]